METVFPKLATVSNYGEMFDLDLALTMPADDHSDSDQNQVSELNSSEFHVYHELPTVAHAAVGACTVCMERFQSDTDGKQVPCGHVYHADCIGKWLSLHNSCPLCRCDVSYAGACSPDRKS